MASKRNTDQKNSNLVIPVDIIFIVDVTGSMGGFLSTAKKVLATSVANIGKVSPVIDTRYSLIVYRDHPPQDNSFASKILVDCGDAQDLDKGMRTRYFEASGGGDTPESGLDAINDISKLHLRKGSIRYAFLAGDAPLHGTPHIKGGSYAKCSCGLSADSVKQIVEHNSIEICGINLSGHAYTTASFSSVCSVVKERSDAAPEKVIVQTLTDICNNISWAHEKLLPVLLIDKFRAAVDIATDLGCSIKDINSGIEILNIAGLTKAFR